ncbi:MAG: NRDE family protein [Saprospiraceae bacterium]|nr:NRDE family protein [Saprospiraceae bacterium]
MCTLTFYPKPTENGSFIVTFNRDETPKRSSVEVVTDDKRGLIYPKDVLHGGTWLAMSALTGRLTCLLNGAFESHKRHLPYRKSRGLVVLESFDYAHPIDFCEQYDFDNIEPFTIILLEKYVFIEFRWDGSKRHIRPLSLSMPQMWSSATLYHPSVQKRRTSWFYEFLRKKMPPITATDIWTFHKTRSTVEPENGLIMQRASGVETVSMTQLTISNLSQTIQFQYNELGNRHIYHQEIKFGHAAVIA